MLVLLLLSVLTPFLAGSFVVSLIGFLFLVLLHKLLLMLK